MGPGNEKRKRFRPVEASGGGSAPRGPAWKRTASSSFDERASKAGEVRHDSEMLGAYGRTALTDLLGAWPRSVDSPVYGRGRLPSDREPRVATEGDPQLVGHEPYPERRGRWLERRTRPCCHSRERACEGIAFFVGGRSSGGDE